MIINPECDLHRYRELAAEKPEGERGLEGADFDYLFPNSFSWLGATGWPTDKQ